MREEERSSEIMQNSSITNDQPEIKMYKSPLDTNDCEGAKEVPVTVTINPECEMGNQVSQYRGVSATNLPEVPVEVEDGSSSPAHLLQAGYMEEQGVRDCHQASDMSRDRKTVNKHKGRKI